MTLSSKLTAAKVGGGVSASFGSSVSFYGSAVFTANSAYRGGGMDIEASGMTSYGFTVFANNTVELSGGGINGFSSLLAFYGNVTLSANTAYQGGGMEIESSDLICDGTVVFDSNKADALGGGISAWNASLKFYGSTTLMGNSAFTGGGMGIESSELICNAAVAIDSNRAKYLGGRLAAYTDSTVSFYGSAVFKANNAYSRWRNRCTRE